MKDAYPKKKQKPAADHRALASQPQRKRKPPSRAEDHLNVFHLTEDEVDLWLLFEWLTSDAAPFEERSPQVQSIERLLDAAHGYRDSRSGSREEALFRSRANNLLLAYQGGWRPRLLERRGEIALVFAQPGNLSQDDQHAYGAIQQLDRLVTHIRRCAREECRDWFFVSKKQTKKRWCSNACGQHVWDSNPANKERKKEATKKAYEFRIRKPVGRPKKTPGRTG
jgi:hypothetical protein